MIGQLELADFRERTQCSIVQPLYDDEVLNDRTIVSNNDAAILSIANTRATGSLLKFINL